MWDLSKHQFIIKMHSAHIYIYVQNIYSSNIGFRAINHFILWLRQHGSGTEKNEALQFQYTDHPKWGILYQSSSTQFGWSWGCIWIRNSWKWLEWKFVINNIKIIKKNWRWLEFVAEKYEVLTDNHFARNYCSFWEEFIFLSDHGDAPKVILKYSKPPLKILLF